MKIDLDKAIRDYGIRPGRVLIGPNGMQSKIISMYPDRREIVLEINGKVYPPADLGRLAYNLIIGKGSIGDQGGKENVRNNDR